MKPRKILHVTQVADGGKAVVVERLVRGLNRERYEPIVLFDTAKTSVAKARLTAANIKTIDLTKNGDEQIPVVPKVRKNRDIGGKVES